MIRQNIPEILILSTCILHWSLQTSSFCLWWSLDSRWIFMTIWMIIKLWHCIYIQTSSFYLWCLIRDGSLWQSGWSLHCDIVSTYKHLLFIFDAWFAMDLYDNLDDHYIVTLYLHTNIFFMSLMISWFAMFFMTIWMITTISIPDDKKWVCSINMLNRPTLYVHILIISFFCLHQYTQICCTNYLNHENYKLIFQISKMCKQLHIDILWL
jgi:hypothetical protein